MTTEFFLWDWTNDISTEERFQAELNSTKLTKYRKDLYEGNLYPIQYDKKTFTICLHELIEELLCKRCENAALNI